VNISFISLRWASFIVLFVSTILAGSLILVQVSNHKLQGELALHAQEVLGNSISNGGLPFAIASNDLSLTKKLVKNYIKNDEIFALEIIDNNGNSIFRDEKKNISNITIEKKTFILLPPFDEVTIDELSIESERTYEPLGVVNIYFSDGKTYEKIKEHTVYVGIILAIVILFIIICFLGFYYYNNKALKASLSEAIKLKNQAEEAEIFKDDFIRTISHDINTPVFAVVNLIDFVYRETKDIHLPQHTIEKIEACYHSSKILSSVTRELFDFDQFQTQKLIANNEIVHIGDFFNFFKDMYQSKFESTDVNFDVVTRDNINIDQSISFDYQKLTRAICNIVDNAYKFTVKGVVELSWWIKEGELYVSIKDSGIGISEQKIDKIFLKHTQLENPITNRFQGRGLGLYYVKCLVDAVGGTISVSSKVGVGTIFDIRLPIEYETDTTPEIVHFNMKGTTALIIDDDVDTCLALKTILSAYGIHAETASIPELGLQQLIKNTPDIVFVDYHMPNLSGDKLLSKARNSLLSKDPIFVCITAEVDGQTIERLGQDFRVVMKKSFSSNEIHSVLQMIYDTKLKLEQIIGNLLRSDEKKPPIDG
jgi:signal transduction histidine kinase/CheY-like chemotaxis protein